MAYDIGTVDVNTFPVEYKRDMSAILFQNKVYRKYAADIILGEEAQGFLLNIALAHYVSIIDVITLKQDIIDLRAAGVTMFPATNDVDIVDHCTDMEDLISNCAALFDADHVRVRAIYAT